MKNKKVLVVEDDKMLSTVFKLFLAELGYDFVGFFANAETALEQIEDLKPDAVLMDIHLPGKIDGIKAAEIIYQKYDVPVIYLTSDTKEATWQRAILTNSYGYLIKPVNKPLLGISIEMALAKHKFDKEIKIRESRYRTLIEDSPDTIIVLTDNKIEFVNYAGLKLFETIYIESLLEKDIYDFVDEDSKAVFKEKIDNAINNKTKTGSFTFNLTTLNHKPVTIEAIGSHIEFKNKSSVQFIFRRIADFSTEGDDGHDKDFLSEVSSNKEAFKALLNASQDAIFVLDKSHTITTTNKAARRFAVNVLRKETSLERPVHEILSFLDKNEFKSLFANSFQGVTHYLNRVIVINDTKYFFKVSIFPILTGNSDGNIENVCISFSDLTETKKIEFELQGIKNDLMPLFDSSIQRFYLVDFNYKIVAFNKSAADIIKDEFNHILAKGDNLLDFRPKERKEGDQYFIDKFNRAKSGEHVIYRQRIVVNGEEQWVEAHLEPISNEKGEIYRILMWTLDITKEKLSEDALVESQKRYYSLFSEANDAILIVDHDAGGILIDCNSKATELFGYSRDEMLGMDLLLLSPEKQPSGTLSEDKRKRKIDEAYQGNVTPFFWKYKRKDGNLFDSEVSLTAIKLEENKRFLYAIIRDVTERKKMEKSLSDHQQKIHSLFEAIPDTIFVINKEGIYTDYKPDVNNTLGMDDDVIGRNINELFKGDKLDEVMRKINEVLLSGIVQSSVYEIPTKKGKKWFEARISKLNDEEVLSVVREITDFGKCEVPEEKLAVK